MNEVLISIKPKWCELIERGQKTIEVRKTKPKIDTPFKCYIYCTKSELLTKSHYNGKIYVATSKKHQNALERNGNVTLSGGVIGEFICIKITRIAHCGYDNRSIALNIVDDNLKCKKLDKGFLYRCQLSLNDIEKYANGGEVYGWHISNLKLYKKPKDISEFYKVGMLSYDDWLYGIYNGNGGARSSYESYKNAFKLSKAPQSWCYVKGVKE